MKEGVKEVLFSEEDISIRIITCGSAKRFSSIYIRITKEIT